MTALAREIWLDSCLAPLAPFLAQAGVTDICINRPGEVWIEALGGVPQCVPVPELTAKLLGRLSRQIAAINAQGVSRAHPLLAGALPDGSRVQIILPPATRGDVAIAIRRHVSAGLTLDDYVATGAFDGAQVRRELIPEVGVPDSSDPQAMMHMLREAVRGRRNILISGGTATGKTTFLNALMREIPADERLILIEDAPELQATHRNFVGLLAARGGQGEAEVTAGDLLIASLRMRPDRIILGEMRGSEALVFLRAVNTGHPGSLSTIHADSPERAIDQLALLVLQSGATMTWDTVVRYITRSLDVIVQLRRENGQRRIEQILPVASLRDTRKFAS